MMDIILEMWMSIVRGMWWIMCLIYSASLMQNHLAIGEIQVIMQLSDHLLTMQEAVLLKSLRHFFPEDI